MLPLVTHDAVGNRRKVTRRALYGIRRSEFGHTRAPAAVVIRGKPMLRGLAFGVPMSLVLWCALLWLAF